jgi:acyl-CoA dehydrogenase
MEAGRDGRKQRPFEQIGHKNFCLFSKKAVLPAMWNLTPSARALALRDRLLGFMDAHIYPNETLYDAQCGHTEQDFWRVPAIMEALKPKAKAAGLWNLFLPPHLSGEGLSNLDYAPLAEIMGRVHWASEAFNCNAPDTGNMELLARYGSEEQKARFLKPMLAGEMKSAFAMTEPEVASSDATNLRTTIIRDGDDYVVNGHKFYITNACDPRLGVFIVLGKTNPDAPSHLQQTQILVEAGTPGIRIARAMPLFGYHDQPHGHADIYFENVRVKASNVILGEGRGFEIAQGRLGPGRIHHCMRIIGVAERLMEKLCARLVSRVAFGKPLADQSLWQDRIADARTEIEMCRLLVLKAAKMMDDVGNKVARSEISQIKVAVPRMGQKLCDMTIQAFGASGVSDDDLLAYTFARLRVMRLGDGPDEVHNRVIAREQLRRYRGQAK